jgi:DNA repair photolyase
MVFDILKKTKTPIFIQTKSILIYRDIEIIRELSKVTTVDISASISTFDENIRKVLEPGAASTIQRMEMLRDFKSFCRKTIVAFMPIIPYLSDDEKNLDLAFRITKEFDLKTIVAYPLHLRNSTKASFIEFIKLKCPEIYTNFTELYKNSNPSNVYTNNLFKKLESLRNKYQLFDTYTTIPKPAENEQLSLF